MKKESQKKRAIAALFLGVFMGITIMIPSVVISSKWINGTNYIYPNSNYSNNVFVNGNLTVNNTIIANEAYMFATFHNDSEPVLSINATQVLYNLSFDTFTSNGFVTNNHTFFTAKIPGLYSVHYSLSFAVTAAGGEYSLVVLKNNVEQTQTESYRSLTSQNVWGSAGAHGYITINAGDNITLNVQDESGSPHNIKLKAHQLTLMRVGNI